MRAVTHEQYGSPDVLQLKEVEKPAPKEDEVLIRVHASSINAMEWHLLSADFFVVRLMGMGLRKPKNPFLGTDVAGVVEAAGSSVKAIQPGDQVFGFGINTYAGYARAKENLIALKPDNLSFEQAAAVPVAAITALQALRDSGHIQAGQNVLIQGASGGVGTFAVQIARAYGAEVTGVCSPRNIEMLRSLGADQVIDYTKEDITHRGQRYDLILAVNGYHPLLNYRQILKPGGVYVAVGGTMGQIFQGLLLGPLISKFGSKKMGGMSATTNQDDLLELKSLLESGKVLPVIDQCYPLEKTAEAFRYFEKAHARGKVVITMR